jgi:hypothetical protein
MYGKIPGKSKKNIHLKKKGLDKKKWLQNIVSWVLEMAAKCSFLGPDNKRSIVCQPSG